MSFCTFKAFRRAAVIVPPLQDFYFTRHRFSSLGATIVSELLRKSGIEVDYYNFPLLRPKGGVTELPPDLTYLRPFLIEGETGKLSYFTTFRHFGPSIDECVDLILANQPGICLFSVFAFCYADTANALADAIKKRMPFLPLMAGGPGPGVHPGYFLRNGGFDYVLAGDAEVSLLPFIKVLDAMTRSAENGSAHLQSSPHSTAGFGKIPDLFWHEDGKVLSSVLTANTGNGDLEFAFVKSAESSRNVTYSTMLSRGCPRSCSFCSSRLTSGGSYRSIPLKKLDTELSCFTGGVNRKSHGKQVLVNIEDDNFLADTEYFGNAVAILKKHFPGTGFIAENGIDYSFLAPATCEWLLSLGMSKFNLSLASLNPEILSSSKRFINCDRYEKIIAFLHRKKIPTVTYFICGFKEDTIESTLSNLSYLNNRHTLIGISLFYAVPGLTGFTDTTLFDDKSSSCCCGSAAFPWNKSLSTETMITAFRLSRFSNLIKGGLFSEKEKRLIEVIINKRELYTMVQDKKGEDKIIMVDRQDRELVQNYFKRINH